MSSSLHIHPAVSEVLRALRKDFPFLHILIGPRQVGKSTAAEQIARQWKAPFHFAAADLPLPPGPEWIAAQWEIARTLASGERPRLLVLDEIQKVV